MKIEVFGPGCPKCLQVEKVAKEALLELGVQGEVEKVKDIGKIVEAGIMITPAVKVNGIVKCSGRVPKIEEVKKWISEGK